MDGKNKNKNIENNLKNIINSSVIVLIGIITSKLLMYIYRIIIARNFGPREYGLLTLSLMISGWFVAFSAIGLSQGLPRILSILKSKGKEKDIKILFFKCIKATSISGLIAFLILFFSSGFISNFIFNEPELEIFIKFFALTVPLTVLFEITLAVFLGYRKIFWYNLLHKTIWSCSIVGLLLILIFFNKGTESIYLSYVFGLLLTLIIAILVFKREYKKLISIKLSNKDYKKSRKLFKELLSYSWPLLFYGGLWSTFHWTDTFLIGYFESAFEVGIYNAAVPIAMLLTIAPKLFLQLFFPLISKEYSMKNRTVVKELTKQVSKWVYSINLLLLGVIILFPDTLLNVLFGPDFSSAANALRILAFGGMFFSLTNVTDRLISATGRSKTILIDLIVVFTINLVLNIYLIPIYGIMGAATSTTISAFLFFIITSYQTKKFISVYPFRKKMVNITFAGIIASLIILSIGKKFTSANEYFLPILLFYVVLYFATIFLFRGMDRNDLMILKSVKNKLRRNI